MTSDQQRSLLTHHAPLSYQPPMTNDNLAKDLIASTVNLNRDDRI
ncbi:MULTISPECIES: hypothetical protein [Chroococcidiopsis]|nr:MULTISPECIES: hypothetical protein [Chroococcidiopsis]